MKRKPEKNYKLPKYAASLAALLFTGSLTGCTDPVGEVQVDGGIDLPEETEYVQLAGDEAIVEDTTQPTTEEPSEETMLAGDVEVVETCNVTETCETGVAEFELGEPPANPRSTEEIALAGDIVMG